MDEIILVDYDPSWPQTFEEEAAILRDLLKDNSVTRVEHFGSTAIPGMPSKPIIDIMAGVDDLARAKETAIDKLAELGYAFWDANPDPEHLFLVKGLPPNGPRTHHLHIVYTDSPEWERLFFRDYLRANPEESARYLALKLDLAERFREDREAYTKGKTDYVLEVTERARIQTE